MLTPNKTQTILFLVAALLLDGCGGDHPHSHGHTHTAPHGGELVELGNHAFNLEILHDDVAGTLGVYVLGGHAERYIRIEQPSIAMKLKSGDEQLDLELQAVADEITKETVGDTSYFSAQSDWLKKEGIGGTIDSIKIKGTSYSAVSFDLSNSHGHAH